MLARLPLVFLLALPAGASEISIQTANPRGGSYGARVDVSSSCALANHAGVGGTLNGGTQEACTSVSSDADVASGSNLFRAGDRVALTDGFEIAAAATFTAVIDGSLFPDAYLVDHTPDSLAIYAARYYLDADQLSLGASDSVYAFRAVDSSGVPWFQVGMKWNPMGGGERRLFVETLEEGGGVRSTENTSELVLPDGWHWLEVGWTAATSASSNDGSVYLCVDDLSTGCSGFDDLDNGEGSVDTVQWGVLEVPNGDFGQVDLDDFASRAGLGIGPEP